MILRKVGSGSIVAVAIVVSLVVATVVLSVGGVSPVSAASASSFVPLTPSRVLDTRSGAKVGAADGNGAALKLNVLNKGGLPGSGIGAVALNVTVVSGENPTIGGGFVTVYPCGTRPDASNLNFTTGQTIPNSVIAPVSTGGDICFYVYGTAHLLADVSGYFPTGFTPGPTGFSFCSKWTAPFPGGVNSADWLISSTDGKTFDWSYNQITPNGTCQPVGLQKDPYGGVVEATDVLALAACRAKLPGLVEGGYAVIFVSDVDNDTVPPSSLVPLPPRNDLWFCRYDDGGGI